MAALAVAATAVVGLLIAGAKYTATMFDADAFPSAPEAGYPRPDEVRCVSLPVVTTTCERQRDAYTAVYEATDDPATIPYLIRGIVATGLEESGQGDAVLRELSDSALDTTGTCARDSLLTAAYSLAKDRQMVGVLPAGIDFALAALKVPALQARLLEKVSAELDEGTKFDQLAVEPVFTAMIDGLMHCTHGR